LQDILFLILVSEKFLLNLSLLILELFKLLFCSFNLRDISLILSFKISLLEKYSLCLEILLFKVSLLEKFLLSLESLLIKVLLICILELSKFCSKF